jgi:argininosuccinate lyase
MVSAVVESLVALRTETSGFIDIFYTGPTIIAQATGLSRDMINFFRVAFSSLRVKKDIMAQRSGEYFAQASDLVDLLVGKFDLSPRKAHAVVGRLVREAYNLGIKPNAVTPNLLAMASEQICGKPVWLSQEELACALDPYHFITVRAKEGETAPEAVRSAIKIRKEMMIDWQGRLAQAKRRLEQSADKLSMATQERLRETQL